MRQVYIASFFAFLILLFFSPSSIWAQAYQSNDNYTGNWEDDISWTGGNSPGLYYDLSSTVAVEGEISTSDNLFFNKGLLSIRDTLIVNGDLGFGNNGDLGVDAGGVLIVLGSLDVGNKVDIAAGGTIIITGDVNFSGSSSQGSFTSDQFPAQVYIGGNVTGSPPTSSSGGAIPVFDCDTAQEHENSECNYGFIEDIEGEEVEEYYQEIICGGGINPGVIESDQTVCEGNSASTITESLPSSESTYQWFSSVDSTDPDTGTWILISGATQQTYDPGVITETIAFCRQVQKGNGCTANSNAVIITFSTNPVPVGVFHE